jgi:hypothetical protein
MAYCLLEQPRSFGATADPLEEAAMVSQVVADESLVGAAKFSNNRRQFLVTSKRQHLPIFGSVHCLPKSPALLK